MIHICKIKRKQAIYLLQCVIHSKFCLYEEVFECIYDNRKGERKTKKVPYPSHSVSNSDQFSLIFFSWLPMLLLKLNKNKVRKWADGKRKLLNLDLEGRSSCHAISTDIPDPFSPPFSIVHCFQQFFRATSCISTELLYVGSSWSSCLCSSMWRGPQEYVTYEFIPTSPAVSRMSGSSHFDSFCNGW